MSIYINSKVLNNRINLYIYFELTDVIIIQHLKQCTE